MNYKKDNSLVQLLPTFLCFKTGSKFDGPMFLPLNLKNRFCNWSNILLLNFVNARPEVKCISKNKT